jgi:phosphoglucosamine mutase
MGGEPSGHIVNLNKTTSGDGIVTALAVLEVMQRNNKPLKELTAGFAKLPQKLVNIHHTKPKEILESEQVKEAVAQVESELGRHGRVLLRLSGTEPVIRIMVEAKDSAEVDRHLQTLRGAVVGSAVTSHT